MRGRDEYTAGRRLPLHVRALKHTFPVAVVVILSAGLVACTGDEPGGDPGVDTDTGAETDAGDERELIFVPITLDEAQVSMTEVVFVPGTDDEVLLLNLSGDVTHARTDGAVLGSFHLSDVHARLDCGLLSGAFDPDFADNGYVYFSYCTSDTASGVYRYDFDRDDLSAIDATAVEIIAAEEPAASQPWHNVGAIGFDGEGNLWAPFGEKTVGANSQDTDNFLGALVRVIPSRVPGLGGYEAAADNPFVAGGGDPAIYAYGLRSPWRAALDPFGNYWIGDVGADRYEEVNWVSRPGQNLGWATHEGPCDGSCGSTTPPVAGYTHGDDDDIFFDDPDVVPAGPRSVWVSDAYPAGGDGPYEGRLDNTILWGEFCMGFVRAISFDAQGVVADRHAAHAEHISSVRLGPDGYLYATSFGQCETRDLASPPPSNLYRLELAE